jgi:DNA-binding winged helix-turn-helix (wHTH) protein
LAIKPATAGTIRFGPFELDERTFEIRRLGRPLRVPRRVFDTIHFLIKNADHVVSKDELFAGPWAGNRVSDAALARSVMLARRVLGDDAAAPRLIITVRSRGFRFQFPPSEPADIATPSGGLITHTRTSTHELEGSSGPPSSR